MSLMYRSRISRRRRDWHSYLTGKLVPSPVEALDLKEADQLVPHLAQELILVAEEEQAFQAAEVQVPHKEEGRRLVNFSITN